MFDKAFRLCVERLGQRAFLPTIATRYVRFDRDLNHMTKTVFTEIVLFGKAIIHISYSENNYADFPACLRIVELLRNRRRYNQIQILQSIFFPVPPNELSWNFAYLPDKFR